MSQQSGRRAPFGTALLGMLLALTASVGLTLAPAAAAQAAGPTSAIAADTTVGAATSHLEPSVLPAARSAAARTIGADRLAGGHAGTAGSSALLVVALVALAVAAGTWCRYASRTPVASRPRAPPTYAVC